MGEYIDRADTLPSSADKSDFYNLIDNARPHAMVDDDGDTKIQVEESADEDKIRMDIAGTEKLVLDSDKLDLIGGQIKFPATAVPSADANTLDDYEEGYHTATVTCSTSGGYTLSKSTLAYTKIGRTVHIQGRLTITGENSPNGALKISLPFAGASLTEDADIVQYPCWLRNHGDAEIENPFLVIDPGNAYALLYNMTDGGIGESLDHTRVDTAFIIGINFTYIAA